MKLIRFYTVILLCLLAMNEAKTQNASLCIQADILVREGNTTITCEPDAPTTIRFKTSKVNTPYAYAITDEDGTILRLSVSDRVSFVGLPGGELRAYAFSYIGNVLAEEGDNIFTDTLAFVCSIVSPNYITVNNIVPDGGTVQSINGLTTEYICTNDHLADILSFQTSEIDEPLYAYIVTDDNNAILNTSLDGNIDFTDASPGVCRVWGIAYTGGLLDRDGEDILTSNLAEGCFDLSDNFVSVIRTEPEGGTITANGQTDMLEACDFSGGNDFTIELDNNNEQNFSYGYIVSDEEETTFTVIEGNTINISDLPAGNSLIRGISYAGQIAKGSGTYPDFTTDQTGCFDLSENAITVTRILVDGGQVALSGGGTEFRACSIDAIPDQFSFQTTSTAMESYAWIVTDEADIILGINTENQIDIDDFQEEIFRIRGLSYRGEILSTLGQHINDVALVDGCAEVSVNFVSITKITPDAGIVSLADGSNSFVGCDSPDLAGQSSIDLSNTSNAGFDFTYLLTDADNNILQIFSEDAILLSDLPDGASRIWGLSYEGALSAQPGENPTVTPPVDGCYDLSDDFLSLERTLVDGGNIFILNDDNDSVLTCGNDDTPDAFTFNSTTTATNQLYVLVVTDENNSVFSAVNGGIIDFDLFAAGTYRVWGLSYTGTLNIPFGSILTEITLSDGCFDLSNNFISIRQEEVNGGQLQYAGGGLEVFTCPGDGNADVLTYVNNGFTSDNYVYLITDDNNVILSSTTANSFDFENAGEGNCRIWGLAYSGILNVPTGEKADTLALSNECFDLSNNFLSVIRQVPSAGTVSLAGGGDITFTCPGDGQPDFISFATTSTYPGSYLYAITGEDNRILDISLTDTYDFDFSAPGNCRVWGIAHTGNTNIKKGDLINEIAISDDCWEISLNYVSIIREKPTAGTVSFDDGTEIKYTCPEDGNADTLFFSNASSYPGSYLYLITDENNKILASTGDDFFDFENAGLGTCRVWGVAYTGTPIFQQGDNAEFVNLSDDCFDRSANFLSVVRDAPSGGTISTPGGEELTFCVGDAFPDVVSLNVSGASNAQYAYLITDENNHLLTTLFASQFDFNNLKGGTSKIYGLSFTGDILLSQGDDILANTITSDCYMLSSNSITVHRILVDGSEIATTSGSAEVEYVCSGDNVPDEIAFQTTAVLDGNVSYKYLITSVSNNILGDLNGNSLDFEGSPFDSLRIWGVAFTGNPELPVGEQINAAVLSDSCYSLSNNFVTIINDTPLGGTVSTLDGSDNIRVCIGGENGLVEMTNSSPSLSGYTYLITTPDLVIVGVSTGNILDFNPLDPGTYLVHGLSYTGQLSANIGDVANATALASSCFELSSNSVQVERTPELDGGTITSPFGDPLFVCLNDGVPDIGAFETTSADVNYRYVITDTLNNIIIPDIASNVIDFEKADPGFCRVYGVSFTGNFTANFGTNVLEDPLSDLCSAVSGNFVNLIKAEFIGGTVSTENGEDIVNVKVGDGIADVIAFDSSGTSGLSYTYVITDETNSVLGLVSGDQQDFEGADIGICRVWGLSYSGALQVVTGDTLSSSIAVLSSGCFNLSSNFVTINRTDDGTPLIENPQENLLTGLEMHLYPNPVSDALSIQLKASEAQLEIGDEALLEVFDVSGRKRLSKRQSLYSKENLFELNVQALPIGMYLLRISNGSARTQKRFFKQ